MEIIDKILSTEIHEAVKIYADDLKKLGKQLYNIDCGSCGNRLIEIYIKLSKNGHQLIHNMITRKAQLKKGVVLRVPSMGITWTNESTDFTDEKAEKVLKEFKALESRFAVLPATKEERDALKEVEKNKQAKVKKKAKELKEKQAKDKIIEEGEKLEAKEKAEKEAELKALVEEADKLEIEYPKDAEIELLKELIEQFKAKK